MDIIHWITVQFWNFIATSSRGKMKKCPFCAEEIQDEAVYCRYCQKDLPEPEPTEEVEKPTQKSGWFSRILAGVFVVLIVVVLVKAMQSDLKSLFPAWLQKEYLWTSILYGMGSEMVSEEDGAALVFVPEGEFLMGFDDSGDEAEKPAHKIWLDSYWIDKTEVTNALFERFIKESGYQVENWRQADGLSWRTPRGQGSSITGLDEHPVVQVTWQDADAYCRWAGRRLPTEAEWEKAAVGWPQNVPFNNPRNFTYSWGYEKPSGDRLNFADKNANDIEGADPNNDDGYKFTAPVGSYPDGASPYGALDMSGNALEWTADWYDPEYYQTSPSSNPTGPWTGKKHVLKGGAFASQEWDIRPFRRYEFNPDMTGVTGFRCAEDFSEGNKDCVACNLRDAWQEFTGKLKCLWERVRDV
jgi:sulfatase modifying factor 1